MNGSRNRSEVISHELKLMGLNQMAIDPAMAMSPVHTAEIARGGAQP